MNYYPSISINDANFAEKLLATYKENGLAVISDVFTENECNNTVDDIVTYFEKLGTGIDRNNIKKTWIAENLPPQTRPGLFQALVSNIPAVWNIRSNTNVKKIFKTLYEKLRNKNITEFIVSGDGINIRPNGIEKTYNKKKDWPHVDQTIPNDVFKCVQGQAVLSNTSASFKASPKSHNIHETLLAKYNIPIDDTSNWLKLKEEDFAYYENKVKDVGGQWQIPILAPKGSFIIWASTLIHSARLPVKKDNDTEDKYGGWRAVVYVCYRPKEEFTEKELKNRSDVIIENRTTNHWGTHVFPKKPGGRYLYLSKYHPMIENMLKNPVLVYEKTGTKLDLTDEQKKLAGF